MFRLVGNHCWFASPRWLKYPVGHIVDHMLFTGCGLEPLGFPDTLGSSVVVQLVGFYALIPRSNEALSIIGMPGLFTGLSHDMVVCMLDCLLAYLLVPDYVSEPY